MDIVAAYREVGTYRGAALMCGTTVKTVKRVLARQEAGWQPRPRPARTHNYDGVPVVAEHGSSRPAPQPRPGWPN